RWPLGDFGSGYTGLGNMRTTGLMRLSGADLLQRCRSYGAVRLFENVERATLKVQRKKGLLHNECLIEGLPKGGTLTAAGVP
ncbi:MAG: hypothetical protein ACP5MD_06080, partial [Verrucomicrobiia bacterium]